MEAVFNNINIANADAENGAGKLNPSIKREKVLVLNQSYEPISVCTPEKATVLLLLSKAELISSRENMFIRSVSRSYPFPGVIRLYGFVRRPFAKLNLTRKNIFKRDDHKCQYCGKKTPDLTIDHVLPRSRGGLDVWENLVTACPPCNYKKADRTPEEAKMPLLNNPKKPTHLFYLREMSGFDYDSWKPFLFM